MAAQGSQTNAKEDTVGLWLADDLNDDIGHFGLDLTTSPVGGTHGLTGAFRDADTTRGLTGEGGREIYIRLDLSATKDKNEVLVAHGQWDDPGSATYAIALNSSAQLECLIDGATSLTHAFTVLSSTVQEVSIAWSTRPNPDTTGAGDALVSELLIYGHTNAAFEEVAQWTHAVGTLTDPSSTFMVGGYGNAGGWSLDSRQVHAVRVGVAWHPNAEFAEDWVATRAAPAADDSPIAVLVPITGASELALEGEWAGSANVGFVAAHNSTRRRALWTAPVNEHYFDAEALTTTPDPTQWERAAPGSGDYILRLDTLRWYAVPAGCSHLAVRLQAYSVAAFDLAVRVYAFNRPPETPSKGEQPKAPPLDFTFVQSDTLNVAHGVGVGEWLTWGGLEIGLLRLPIWTPEVAAYRDTVHVALAYYISNAAAELTIRAWHARPTVKFIGQGID